MRRIFFAAYFVVQHLSGSIFKYQTQGIVIPSERHKVFAPFHSLTRYQGDGAVGILLQHTVLLSREGHFRRHGITVKLCAMQVSFLKKYFASGPVYIAFYLRFRLRFGCGGVVIVGRASRKYGRHKDKHHARPRRFV